MASIFQLNLANPDERKELLYRVKTRTVKPLTEGQQAEPAGLYFAALIGILLWLLPVGKRLPPWMSLVMTGVGVGFVGMVQDDLDKLQKKLDKANEDSEYDDALNRTTAQQFNTTKRYTTVTQARLAVSADLPTHLVEPDLVDPQVEKDADYEEFKAVMGITNTQNQQALPTKKPLTQHLPAKSNGGTHNQPAQFSNERDSPLVPGDSNGDGVAPAPPESYKFFKRRNAQNAEVLELCIDLKQGYTHYCGLPIVNLAAEMAQEIRSVLGVGPTGTGKSRLIEQAIYEQHLLNENADFTIFAHKNSNQKKGEKLPYCGLEDSTDMYLLTMSMNDADTISHGFSFYQRFKVLKSLIEEGCDVPTVFAIDQVNQGLVAAKKVDRLLAQDEDSSKIFLEDTYKEDLATLLVDGREKSVKGWAFGHANTNEALGLQHQIKENVCYVGLGRANNYSAVLNPLKDGRFIVLTSERNRLKAQFKEYMDAHLKNGAPVNVVLAITNCGVKGWQLVVLPQYDKPPKITLGITNPPKQATEPLEAPERSNVLPDRERRGKDFADIRKSLDKQYRQQDAQVEYTARQKEIAGKFIKWIKINRHDFIDTLGLLDPEYVSYYFDEVSTPEQMELILQLLTDIGGGAWVEHPRTGMKAWQLKGAVPVREQEGLLCRDRTAAPTPPEQKTELVPLPNGITEAMFEDFIYYLSTKCTINALETPNGFLSSSYRLKSSNSNTSMNTAQIRTVLHYLHRLGVVDFPNLDCPHFRLLRHTKTQNTD